MLVLAIALAAIYLFPLYWMYVTSLKGQLGNLRQPADLLAARPESRRSFPRPGCGGPWATFLWNSLVIGSGVTALTVLLGTGCAYVLARYRSAWIDVGLFPILMLQVLPASVMITPLYVGFNQLGLLNFPRTAVVLAAAAKAIPFYIVLVRATFMNVPRELEEAALVDGNSRWGAFFFIVLPLARNGILVLAILTFMQALRRVHLLQVDHPPRKPISRPASGCRASSGPNSTDWNGIMAYAAMYVTPIVAIFVILQRRIVAGLTSGALK